MTAKHIIPEENSFQSYLSFEPLIAVLKKSIATGKPGAQKLYGQLISDFESQQALLQPISDLSVLKPHKELIETLLATVFPPATSETENLYAVSKPLQYQIIYSSHLFRHMFIKPGSNEVNIPDDETGNSLRLEKLRFAYQLILRKFRNVNLPETSASIHSYKDNNGLTRYHSLRVDSRFVNVKINDDFELPANVICPKTNQVMSLSVMQEKIPLKHFTFEGLALIRIEDITEQQVIAEIKNTLLDANAFADSSMYSRLELHIQSLIGLTDIRIGITPFFKINGHYIYSDLHNSNSLLYKQYHSPEEKNELNECCFSLFQDNDLPVVFEKLSKSDIPLSVYMKLYFEQGVRSLIISPLKHENELLGVLEIVSEKEGMLNHSHIGKIEEAIPLFTLALKRSAETLDTQIDKVIKSQFTAIQPTVEWKFTETAFRYLVQKHQQEDAKIERIAFEEVFPLYGAIDIRNSSVERSHAIQLDLIEQLNMAQRIIIKAQSELNFPLLQEVQYKINKYITSASDSLLSDEELQIHDFLQHQVISIFNHLQSAAPAMQEDIKKYYAALDPQMKMIYLHRKSFDESITALNTHLSRFIDKEQVAAQQVYHHYFERYVTDGVEFNIYIGQSLSPRIKFDDLYLKNMKMWQLLVLAKGAKLAASMKKTLPLPLETTQLILAHSQPISISFRPDERKFDVDGAYNIRYEIIKKRIDKVHIKNSNERLTQPGKIAIVYSQPKEALEYKEFIEFLQSQHLLLPGIEEYDLEELQGVLGLKALRVGINTAGEQKKDTKVQLSKTTTLHLVGQ